MAYHSLRIFMYFLFSALHYLHTQKTHHHSAFKARLNTLKQQKKLCVCVWKWKVFSFVLKHINVCAQEKNKKETYFWPDFSFTKEKEQTEKNCSLVYLVTVEEENVSRTIISLNFNFFIHSSAALFMLYFLFLGIWIANCLLCCFLLQFAHIFIIMAHSKSTI